jgi:hypothetical protein
MRATMEILGRAGSRRRRVVRLLRLRQERGRQRKTRLQADSPNYEGFFAKYPMKDSNYRTLTYFIIRYRYRYRYQNERGPMPRERRQN